MNRRIVNFPFARLFAGAVGSSVCIIQINYCSIALLTRTGTYWERFYRRTSENRFHRNYRFRDGQALVWSFRSLCTLPLVLIDTN